MRWMMVAALAAGLAGPAAGQGLQLPGTGGQGGLPGNIPGRSQSETPQQKREFCQRVGSAAMRCGLTLDPAALSTCLVRSLPAQDSLRVAQAANAARGDATALLGECGVGH
jgi:hypothetical protein